MQRCTAERRKTFGGNLAEGDPKGAQAGARKREQESDEAVVAGKRGNASGYPPSDSESRSDAHKSGVDRVPTGILDR